MKTQAKLESLAKRLSGLGESLGSDAVRIRDALQELAYWQGLCD